MSLSSQLPFALNHTSLAQWLERQSSQEPLDRGHALYKVLKLFKNNNAGINTDQLMLCADQLTRAVMAIVNTLQHDLMMGHEVLTTSQCKVARLIIVLLELVAYLQSCLALRGSDVAKRRRSCDTALQLLVLSRFHSALSHSQTPSGHWRTLGEIYQVCLLEGFLNSPVAPYFKLFRQLPVLESLLKCHLLFSASQPLRFNRKELPELFRFCVQHHDKIQLNQPTRYGGNGFVWNYAEAKAPVPTLAESPKTGLLFNTDELVKADRNRELILEGFDIEAFWDGVTHYSSLARKEYAPTMAVPYVFTNGYDQVCRFFKNHVREGKVSRINSPSPDKIKFSSFDLVRDEEKDNGANQVKPEAIWSKHEEPKIKKVHFDSFRALNLDRINFIDSRLTGFTLVEQDLLALYRADMQPSLAIVRFVESVRSFEGDSTSRALMEILPGEVSLSELRMGESTETVLLLSRGKKTELIMDSGQYAIGASVELNQHHYRLIRLIEEAGGFVRFLISSTE